MLNGQEWLGRFRHEYSELPCQTESRTSCIRQYVYSSAGQMNIPAASGGDPEPFRRSRIDDLYFHLSPHSSQGGAPSVTGPLYMDVADYERRPWQTRFPQ